LSTFFSFSLLLNRITAVPTIHSSQLLLGTPSPAETPTCRSAFKKRETRRLLEQLSEAATSTSTSTAENCEHKEAISSTKAKEQGTQTRKWNPPIPKNKIKTRNVGVQCVMPDLSQDSCENCSRRKRTRKTDLELEVESEESENETPEEEIELYQPEFDENASDSEDEVRADEMRPYTDKCQPHKEPKYIVFHNKLLLLLSICLTCYSTDVQLYQKLSGCMLIVFIKCLCCKTLREWRSQPEIKGTPYGNVLLSGSILFTGALPSKVIRLLTSLSIACISPRTFFRHQQRYLHQVVSEIWLSKRDSYLVELKDEQLIVGGDGRCDSMGHCAKYGSYTAIELTNNKVLTVELVQSNETTSSNAMELMGLKKMVDVFNLFNLNVRDVVTDRHKQINKWIREDWEVVDHFYDCWHVAKSIKKKLQALAKKKNYEVIGQWIKSIVNHFYWSVTSSEHNNKDLIEAKWRSIINHVQNKHDGHSDLFPNCAHDDLPVTEIRSIKWLQPDTEVFEALEKIILDKNLIKDIAKCSKHGQTSVVEGYHSLVNQFAPKMFHFSYDGMRSRLYLAALHYNENSSRPQKKNLQNEEQYNIIYPKYKKGGHIVRKILEDCSYGYVDDLLISLTHAVENGQRVMHRVANPPPLCSAFTRPDKDQAVAEHTTRFARV